MVQRQAEGVGMRAQGKLRAQGNYKTGRARDQKKRAKKEKFKKTLKATYGYVENIKQVSESDSLFLRSAGLTRAASS